VFVVNLCLTVALVSHVQTVVYAPTALLALRVLAALVTLVFAAKISTIVVSAHLVSMAGLVSTPLLATHVFVLLASTVSIVKPHTIVATPILA